jgi:hypothetical protein
MTTNTNFSVLGNSSNINSQNDEVKDYIIIIKPEKYNNPTMKMIKNITKQQQEINSNFHPLEKEMLKIFDRIENINDSISSATASSIRMNSRLNYVIHGICNIIVLTGVLTACAYWAKGVINHDTSSAAWWIAFIAAGGLMSFIGIYCTIACVDHHCKRKDEYNIYLREKIMAMGSLNLEIKEFILSNQQALHEIKTIMSKNQIQLTYLQKTILEMETLVKDLDIIKKIEELSDEKKNQYEHEKILESVQNSFNKIQNIEEKYLCIATTIAAINSGDRILCDSDSSHVGENIIMPIILSDEIKDKIDYLEKHDRKIMDFKKQSS